MCAAALKPKKRPRQTLPNNPTTCSASSCASRCRCRANRQPARCRSKPAPRAAKVAAAPAASPPCRSSQARHCAAPSAGRGLACSRAPQAAKSRRWSAACRSMVAGGRPDAIYALLKGRIQQDKAGQDVCLAALHERGRRAQDTQLPHARQSACSLAYNQATTPAKRALTRSPVFAATPQRASRALYRLSSGARSC